MPTRIRAKEKSLRDLIESRAASHSMAPRKLCHWALTAIEQNALPVILPDKGASLDTKLDLGGMLLTWRSIIARALDRIERVDPAEFNWFRSLKCDPSLFDKWLNTKLQATSLPASSRFPVRKRATDAEVWGVVKNYVDSEKALGRVTAIPRMWEYVKNELPNATRDQAKVALRDIEGGPKRRGRPRKSRSAS